MAKRFSEISPLTYKISVEKGIIMRKMRDLKLHIPFAEEKSPAALAYSVYTHESQILRRLGGTDMRLQENKAVNLALALPHLSGILIKPGEVFSFWHLVGSTTEAKGYREGLTISNGKPSTGIGGGMCQFSNLIHWLALHSELTVTERHHHESADLFPDDNRTVPFGTGTSIFYNYLDYRFENTTGATFQMLFKIENGFLVGDLRSSVPPRYAFDVYAEDEQFTSEGGKLYRTGKVVRVCTDEATGRIVSKEVLQENHAEVMYER